MERTIMTENGMELVLCYVPNGIGITWEEEHERPRRTTGGSPDV
jgi:hypothetical protein